MQNFALRKRETKCLRIPRTSKETNQVASSILQIGGGKGRKMEISSLRKEAEMEAFRIQIGIEN
jgi:hypothetical protein